MTDDTTRDDTNTYADVVDLLRGVTVASPDFRTSVDATVSAGRRASRLRVGAGAVIGVAASVAALLGVAAIAPDVPPQTYVVDAAGKPATPVLPSDLVGQWSVKAEGEEAGAILTIGADEYPYLVVFRTCGHLSGPWAARRDGLFVGAVFGGSSKCFRKASQAIAPVDPLWIRDAVRFAGDGDRRVLIDGQDRVLATLTPGPRPSPPKDAGASLADPPVLTAERKAQLDAVPTAVPSGVRPADVTSLLGEWVLPDRPAISRHEGVPSYPMLRFNNDGSWTGSDGCNASGGRWRVTNGDLILLSGGTTDVGCENIDLAADVALAGFRGGTLELFDAGGTQLRSLVRNTAASSVAGTGGIAHLLRTHCGVMSTKVAGVLWLADPPLHDDSGNPPPGWDNPGATGIFVQLSDTEAEFRADSGMSAHFRRAPAGAKDPYQEECN